MIARSVLIVVSAAILSACGVDGPPVPPSEAQAQNSGVTVSGSVAVGVSGG